MSITLTTTASDLRALLGGKGANLAEMSRLDVPVPPGFTITAEACNEYFASNETFPESLHQQIEKALKKIEKATGKTFGDSKKPLLVSCRSGSKFSIRRERIRNKGRSIRCTTPAAMLPFLKT